MFWGIYLGEWGRSGGSFSLSLCLEMTTPFPKGSQWQKVQFDLLMVTVPHVCLAKDSWQSLGWAGLFVGALRSGWGGWGDMVGWTGQSRPCWRTTFGVHGYGALVWDIPELVWCCIFWMLTWNMQLACSGRPWGISDRVALSEWAGCITHAPRGTNSHCRYGRSNFLIVRLSCSQNISILRRFSNRCQ